jgi:hypothetical protein
MQPMGKPISTLSDSKIARRILSVRGLRVMLDRDLAVLYGVSTKQPNQQVLRNRDRFPSDFMLQVTPEEAETLRLQIATSNRRWGGRRYLPHAFTKQGVAMLSGVLHSRRAVRVNLEIMRTFVKLRQILSSHAELARKLEELERRYEGQFRIVFDAIRELMAPESPESRPVGFRP